MVENPYESPLDSARAAMSSVSAGKKWAISCYIPVFNIVTCILTSVRMVNNKFCLFHARQGLVLFALWFLTIIIALISPVLSLMLWGVVLLLHISGIVIAASGNQTSIPMIGKISARIPETHIFTMLTGKTPEDESGQ